MFIPQPPKNDDKMIISAQDIMNAPKGHLPRIAGCGIHKSKRHGRRNNTRSAQFRRSIKE